jgi:excisionase family DNA binding protein
VPAASLARPPTQEAGAVEASSAETLHAEVLPKKKRRPAPARRARPWPLARELREMLRRERQMAVETRDPLAIRYAGERYESLTDALAGIRDEMEVDLDSITLGISQAAKALGYTPFQVREMIRQRKLPAHKVNSQWRIPLRLVW